MPTGTRYSPEEYTYKDDKGKEQTGVRVREVVVTTADEDVAYWRPKYMAWLLGTDDYTQWDAGAGYWCFVPNRPNPAALPNAFATGLMRFDVFGEVFVTTADVN